MISNGLGNKEEKIFDKVQDLSFSASNQDV